MSLHQECTPHSESKYEGSALDISMLLPRLPLGPGGGAYSDPDKNQSSVKKMVAATCEAESTDVAEPESSNRQYQQCRGPRALATTQILPIQIHCCHTGLAALGRL